jgi:hypothetical protein
VIEEVPLAHSRRPVDFAGGPIAIAWGDLAIAYVSTGIPNIETYASMPPAAAIASRAQLGTIASAPVQHLLVRIADRSKGPSEEELRTGRSRFWGEVRNSTGERRTARLETANGYRLTADGMIMAVKFAGARAGRRLLHAEHADGRALRGTIARVDSHPRGLETAQRCTTRGAVAPISSAAGRAQLACARAFGLREAPISLK